MPRGVSFHKLVVSCQTCISKRKLSYSRVAKTISKTLTPQRWGTRWRARYGLHQSTRGRCLRHHAERCPHNHQNEIGWRRMRELRLHFRHPSTALGGESKTC